MNPATAPRPRDAQPVLVRLGKYEMLTRLAVGGMAELFIARTVGQHGFEKLVALKRILAAHAEDPQFIEMLLAEARLAATLHHPNIAQVYDVGEVDGTYFFTMEYVFGQDLRQIVRAIQGHGAWLSPEHILQIIIGTAAGLHYAHQSEDSDGALRGVVHRDVSPSNILVSFDGSVKLVDFGIARVSTLQSTTGLGALKGKVPYMSPEQCRGEHLDRRSDIFSLGILLWELTVRRRLFAGPNDLVIAAKICNEDVPAPTSIDPDYPPALERIVLKTLARDRDQRYATAEELQLDLEEYARENMLLLSSVTLGHFMTEHFSELITSTKSLLRERIASATDMFPLLDEPSAGASMSSSRPAPSRIDGAAVTIDDTALADGSGHSHRSLTAPELLHPPAPVPAPDRRRLWVSLAAAGLTLLAIILLLVRRDPPAPVPVPVSAPVATAGLATPPPPPPTPTPDPQSTPPSTPPDPATPAPTTAPTPTPTPTPTPASDPTPDPAIKPIKPKSTRKPSRPTTWDPDSPLPPP